MHEESDEDGVTIRDFLVDALLNLIHDGNADSGLTLKYYATKIIRFVRCKFAQGFWTKFKQNEMSEDDNCYYEGLVHFSQWFQPLKRIHISRVKFDVECIALSSIEQLYSKYPKHSFFDPEKVHQVITKSGTSLPSYDRYLFPRKNISLNSVCFNAKETFQLLDALNHVMFEAKGFRGNTSNYYNPNNSFIDMVLETRQGIPITLCILYSLVAVRLGIRLEPINFPRHFLLRWTNVVLDRCERMYIDAFQKGKRFTEAEVKGMDEENTREHVAARPIEVNWYPP